MNSRKLEFAERLFKTNKFVSSLIAVAKYSLKPSITGIACTVLVGLQIIIYFIDTEIYTRQKARVKLVR